MDLRTALTTTGAVRDFSDQPVADEVVHRILNAARFAPSGGNRQAWHIVMVKDPGTRRQLRDLYLPGWYEYLAMMMAGVVPWAPVTDRAAEAAAIEHAADMVPPPGQPGGFAEHFDEAPVLLVLLADLRSLAAVDRDHDRYTLIGGASIYPFAWSILLAAHEEGLGGVMTTMLAREEASVCQVLHVPDGWALAAGIALGYPARSRPTRLKRTPVERFATLDAFDGSPLI